MVFPPAMFMAVLVSQGDVGESHDLIIAVDGERTRNIADLEDALDRAHNGEIVYLVVVRRAGENASQYACPVSCRHIRATSL
jgi:hypothetical protein